MTVAAWKPGTLYLPGDIVRSTASSPVTNQVIPNADFESGDTAWTKTNVTIENVAGFTGAWRAKMVYAGGSTGRVVMASALPISAGQTVNASCMLMPSGGTTTVGGQVRVMWFDASSAYITGKDVVGNPVDVSNGSGWRKSSVRAIAPSNAASFKVQAESYNASVTGVVLFDAFMLSVTGGPASNNLIFKATQTDPATSGTSEPVWPTTVGGTVVDGGVTWTAIDAVVITWEASPILESGATEPTWPTNLGDTVADGSIAWEVVSRRIEDENCPNSKVVLILASKVYATDEDIVRFSATANPKDWTSMQDAGYLPTGLQSANANDMAVLAQYRGNLVPMNANCMQNWQVDPDPQAMAILDQMEGIGSTWNKAAQPVANDLFYLSQLGVRSIGISASTENLAAGDVGMPIDELVQAAINVATLNETGAIATYYPGSGQYWLAFKEFPPPAPSIIGDVPDGIVGESVSGAYVATSGWPPYSDFTLVSGSLPPGILLNTNGTYGGTFTTAGEYEWVVSVTDSVGGEASLTDTSTVSSFWLTSRPYPVSLIESALSQSLIADELRKDPVVLTTEPALTQSIGLSAFAKAGGQVTFTQPPEPALTQSIGLSAFAKAGGQVTFTQPAEPALTQSIGLSAFGMAGGQVNYSATEPALTQSIGLTAFAMA